MSTHILLAMDDSENALRAVNLVADCFRPDSRVTLFNVAVDTATLCQMDSPALTPYFKSQQSQFCALEEKKRHLVNDAIQKARQILLERGFAADLLATKIQPKKMGVARDILAEARSGYDIVVMGRRGLSGVKEFFSGSTSNKVFNYAKDITVLIVP
jgi:nucleotide-binding universal stress UspA family protein